MPLHKMDFRSLVLIFVLVVGTMSVHSEGSRGLQPNEFSTRIIGGGFADASRYGYAQVSLQDFIGHTCGATVVAPDVVLTAAHCASAFGRVVVGLYDLNVFSENVEQLGVENEYVHGGYDEYSTRYDVMLVKLDGSITVVDPVRINADQKIPTVADTLSVVGWGATLVTETNVEYPDFLHEVDLSYIPNFRCRQFGNEDGLSLGFTLFDDMMCAGDVGRDSCYGDSGGPLLILGEDPADDVQVGVVSWGYECAGPIPGIYHRLSKSYGWIQSTICEISDSPPEYFKCNTPAPTMGPAPSESPTAAPTAAPTGLPTTSPTFLPTAPPTSSAPLHHAEFGCIMLAIVAALL